MDPDARQPAWDRGGGGGRPREGLSQALDPDTWGCYGLRLAQRRRVGLATLHPVDLEEEILALGRGTLLRVGNTVAVGVDHDTELEVAGTVPVEVDPRLAVQR